MVNGASWRAYLCKNPGARLRDFISLKSGKLNTRLSEIRHFWENFIPNEWQSARTPFILLPKEEPKIVLRVWVMHDIVIVVLNIFGALVRE